MKVKVTRRYEVSIKEIEDPLDIITIYDFGDGNILSISHKENMVNMVGITLYELQIVCLPNYHRYQSDRVEVFNALENKVRNFNNQPANSSSSLTENKSISNRFGLLEIEDNEDLVIQKLVGIKLHCKYFKEEVKFTRNSISSKTASIELRPPTALRGYYLLFICYSHPRWFNDSEIIEKIEAALNEFDIVVKCEPGYGFPPQEGFIGIALLPG